MFFNGCNSVSNISGNYVNSNDSLVQNYLKLNKDMTYLHFYNNGNVILSQKGIWELRKRPAGLESSLNRLYNAGSIINKNKANFTVK